MIRQPQRFNSTKNIDFTVYFPTHLGDRHDRNEIIEALLRMRIASVQLPLYIVFI